MRTCYLHKARFGGLFWGEAMSCDETIDRRDLIPADLGRIQYMFDDDQLQDMLEAAQHVPGIWQVAIDNPCLAWMLACHDRFVPNLGNPQWDTLHERLGFRRRDLLGWLGWPAEKWCVRLLSKVVMETLTLDDLLGLREACTQGMLPKGLLHLPFINAQIIRVATHPELARVVKFSFYDDLAGVTPSTPADEMIRFCMAMDRHKNAGRKTRYANVTQLQLRYESALLGEARYRYDAYLLRKYSREDFPDPIIRVPLYSQPSGIRLELFHSVRDLYEHARDQHNCLFSYVGKFFAGEVFLLKLIEPVKGTVSLKQRVDGTWQIDEYEVADNHPISRRVLWEIAGYLNRQLNKGGAS